MGERIESKLRGAYLVCPKCGKRQHPVVVKWAEHASECVAEKVKCKECSHIGTPYEFGRLTYAQRQERKKASKREWYEKHKDDPEYKERRREYSRRYRETHKEQIAKYRQEHREERNVYLREWYAKHKDDPEYKRKKRERDRRYRERLGDVERRRQGRLNMRRWRARRREAGNDE